MSSLASKTQDQSGFTFCYGCSHQNFYPQKLGSSSRVRAHILKLFSQVKWYSF